jgi:hypothetical protein
VARKILDFDSAIPWFESRRPSQNLSQEIKRLKVTARSLSAIFMLHHVAENLQAISRLTI